MRLKEICGCHLKDLQGLRRKSQSSELSGYCTGPVDFIQSYGVQYEFENPLSWVTLRFFPRKSQRSQWRHGEKFHQDIFVMEKRCQGKWTSSNLTGYCWTQKRNVQYLTPNTFESYTPVQFRGKFLPVSWTSRVLFCTFKFLYIFETLPI